MWLSACEKVAVDMRDRAIGRLIKRNGMEGISDDYSGNGK